MIVCEKSMMGEQLSAPNHLCTTLLTGARAYVQNNQLFYFIANISIKGHEPVVIFYKWKL